MDKKADVEKLNAEIVKRGGLLANLYFDLHATKKETLTELGTTLVQKILDHIGVVYARGEIDEPVEAEGLFSTTVDVKVLVKELPVLARVCGDHSPYSVEILKPDELRLSVDQMQDILMNISTNNYELKKLILEKVYKPEDLETFRKSVSARVKLGKKFTK